MAGRPAGGLRREMAEQGSWEPWSAAAEGLLGSFGVVLFGVILVLIFVVF